jgi:hypothetical protein
VGHSRTTVAIAILLAIMAGSGRADADERLVVLGLRPTDSSRSKTEIRRLAEAQRTRSLIENLIQFVSGRTVLGHEDLSKLLGNSYMVEVFDCGQRLDCIRSRVAPLARAGHRTAVYGSDWVEGDTHHFEIFTFSLVDAKVAKRVEFQLTSEQLEDSTAWRQHIDSLFTNKGKILVVSNVSGFECTVDGTTCAFDEDGRTLVVSPGEHAVELTKKGYKAAARAVTVVAGAQQQLAFALEELPPRPGSASPTGLEGSGEPSGATQPGVTPVAGLAFGGAFEKYNVVDGVDNPAPPPNTPKLWSAAVFNTASFVGATFKDVKRGAWQASAFAVVGLYGKHQFRMPIVRVTLANEGAGLTFQLGRMFIPTVNVTQPGLLVQTGIRFGQFIYCFNGAKLSKSLGRKLLVDVGIGRPENFVDTDIRAENIGQRYVLEYRLTHLQPGVMGTLYGKKVPLTFALGGGYGLHRAGTGEVTPMGAAMPVVENLTLWVFAGEAIVPLGPLVLTGAGYVGQGAGFFGAAQSQRARIDPATGTHRTLRSAGGWAQLSLPLGSVEVAMVAGQDSVYKNLGYGIDAFGSTADIKSNRVGAGVVTYQITKRLKLGEQLQYIQTGYKNGTTSNVVAITFAFFQI